MKKLLLILTIATVSCAFTWQIFNIKLNVTIVDASGKAVENAKVALYSSDGDHTKEEDMLQSGKTNSKGVVVFKKLETKAYYLAAEKGKLDNSLGDHKTGEMHKGKINKITLTIE